MTGQIKLTGMVLISMPVGDYDRRLTILTRERGKISAFAKGARKPTSALLGLSQPFAFGEFVLFEGKTSYNVVGADISNYFAELRDDMSAIYYAMYFCEFCTYMTKENMEAGEVLKLLYTSLRALTKPSLNKKLIRRVFELRFMAVNGEMPRVDACVLCGKEEMLKEPKAWFSAEEGGILCDACRQKRLKERETLATSSGTPGTCGGRAPWDDMVLVGTSTVYTMQYILATPFERLFAFTVSEEVLSELENVMTWFLNKHVGHTMKSEEMLDIF